MTDEEVTLNGMLGAALGGTLTPGLQLPPDFQDEKLIHLAVKHQTATARERNERRRGPGSPEPTEAEMERALALSSGARWAFRAMQPVPPRTMVGVLVKATALRTQARLAQGADMPLRP